MNSIKVLTVASNFPDIYYPTIAPWSKKQVDAIHKYTNVEVEVVVPRPYTIPINFFPYHNFARLPLHTISEEGYHLHFPRFPYLIPKKFLFPLTGDLYSLFISRFIENNIKKPDLIHARFSYLDGYGVLNICKKWNIPLVVDVHGSTEFKDYYFSIFLGKKQRKTINQSDKIICVAQWQVKKGLDLGIPEGKITCIPLGVDINTFKPRNKEKIRHDFNITEQKIILFVGQLNKEKGVDYLLKAISKIYSKSHYNKDVRIIIIGYGSENENLTSLSKQLGITDKVTFTGPIMGEKLAKWYSLADIFVLPSLIEGRPSVINEAMASECAIVATNIGGIPEQVNDGYNGFLIEPKNIDMLAEKINYLLTNENEMIRMGKNSRKKIIEEGWTWEGYAKKIEEVYKRVLDEK
jgi:teichuronic acid biosynthesis glycosyltransferase TuaC